MKKIIVILCLAFLLAACERPATQTSWSPINPTSTSIPEATAAKSSSTPADETASPSSIPTFDLAQLPAALPHSMKGYELVSWKNDGDWNFTLVTGTNRQKTFEELISGENYFTKDGYVKLTVEGVEKISKILELIPAGETVNWGGINLNGQVPSGTIYFSYPPQNIIDTLLSIAKDKGFELITLEETE
jgi:hypothetical protein